MSAENMRNIIDSLDKKTRLDENLMNASVDEAATSFTVNNNAVKKAYKIFKQAILARATLLNEAVLIKIFFECLPGMVQESEEIAADSGNMPEEIYGPNIHKAVKFHDDDDDDDYGGAY